MEGHISLGDFIEQVKAELMEAHEKSTKRFLALREVELEVQFTLGVEGEVKGKLIVVEGQGKASATQTHKARLKFVPGSEMGDPFFVQLDRALFEKAGLSNDDEAGRITRSESADEWVFEPAHNLQAELFKIDKPISVRISTIPANDAKKDGGGIGES